MRRPRRAPRHLSRQPFGTPASCAAPYGARHRIAPLSRARPHATARCSLARQTCRPAGAVSRAAAQWPSRIRPPSRATATWRTVPLRRVNRMLPRDCGEARRHPNGAVTNAGRSVRQRRPKAASECGALYHPVITPASAACLADPLPHKAWTPLLPPVTTPYSVIFHAIPTGVVTGGSVIPVPAPSLTPTFWSAGSRCFILPRRPRARERRPLPYQSSSQTSTLASASSAAPADRKLLEPRQGCLIAAGKAVHASAPNVHTTAKSAVRLLLREAGLSLPALE